VTVVHFYITRQLPVSLCHTVHTQTAIGVSLSHGTHSDSYWCLSVTWYTLRQLPVSLCHTVHTQTATGVSLSHGTHSDSYWCLSVTRYTLRQLLVSLCHTVHTQTVTRYTLRQSLVSLCHTVHTQTATGVSLSRSTHSDSHTVHTQTVTRYKLHFIYWHSAIQIQFHQFTKRHLQTIPQPTGTFFPFNQKYALSSTFTLQAFLQYAVPSNVLPPFCNYGQY
jgi:hypothetical protein